MKRLLTFALVLCLTFLSLGLTACRSDDNYTVISIGATPTPHAEILEYISPFLLEEGIRLEIVEFTEFFSVNPALADGSLDANYFQHVPFLDTFISDFNTPLHVVGAIHVEPMGAYSMSLSCITELFYGAEVAIPECATNGPRALLLLQRYGFLTLNPDLGIRAGVGDILYNPLNLQFIEIAAAMLPRAMLAGDADLSIINTNHVLAGTTLSPWEDSLIMEEISGNPYANVLVVRPEDADNEAILALLRHLQSDRVRQFILENFDGVVPVF